MGGSQSLDRYLHSLFVASLQNKANFSFQQPCPVFGFFGKQLDPTFSYKKDQLGSWERECPAWSLMSAVTMQWAFPRWMQLPAYRDHPRASWEGEEWKLFLAAPFIGFPFFFSFWCLRLGLINHLTLTGLVGQDLLHSGNLASSPSQFSQLKKGESSVLWRTRVCQWPPGKHHYKTSDGFCPEYATLWKMMARMLIPSRLPWGSSHGINWVTWRWMVALSSNMEYLPSFICPNGLSSHDIC